VQHVFYGIESHFSRTTNVVNMSCPNFNLTDFFQIVRDQQVLGMVILESVCFFYHFHISGSREMGLYPIKNMLHS
jgi:hypothetical protein